MPEHASVAIVFCVVAVSSLAPGEELDKDGV